MKQPRQKGDSERREQRAQLSTNFKAVVDEARSYREAKLSRGRDLSRAVRCSFLSSLAMADVRQAMADVGKTDRTLRDTLNANQRAQRAFVVADEVAINPVGPNAQWSRPTEIWKILGLAERGRISNLQEDWSSVGKRLR